MMESQRNVHKKLQKQSTFSFNGSSSLFPNRVFYPFEEKVKVACQELEDGLLDNAGPYPGKTDVARHQYAHKKFLGQQNLLERGQPSKDLQRTAERLKRLRPDGEKMLVDRAAADKDSRSITGVKSNKRRGHLTDLNLEMNDLDSGPGSTPSLSYHTPKSMSAHVPSSNNSIKQEEISFCTPGRAKGISVADKSDDFGKDDSMNSDGEPAASSSTFVRLDYSFSDKPLKPRSAYSKSTMQGRVFTATEFFASCRTSLSSVNSLMKLVQDASSDVRQSLSRLSLECSVGISPSDSEFLSLATSSSQVTQRPVISVMTDPDVDRPLGYGVSRPSGSEQVVEQEASNGISRLTISSNISDSSISCASGDDVLQFAASDVDVPAEQVSDLGDEPRFELLSSKDVSAVISDRLTASISPDLHTGHETDLNTVPRKDMLKSPAPEMDMEAEQVSELDAEPRLEVMSPKDVSAAISESLAAGTSDLPTAQETELNALPVKQIGMVANDDSNQPTVSEPADDLSRPVADSDTPPDRLISPDDAAMEPPPSGIRLPRDIDTGPVRTGFDLMLERLLAGNLLADEFSRTLMNEVENMIVKPCGSEVDTDSDHEEETVAREDSDKENDFIAGLFSKTDQAIQNESEEEPEALLEGPKLRPRNRDNEQALADHEAEMDRLLDGAETGVMHSDDESYDESDYSSRSPSPPMKEDYCNDESYEDEEYSEDSGSEGSPDDLDAGAILKSIQEEEAPEPRPPKAKPRARSVTPSTDQGSDKENEESDGSSSLADSAIAQDGSDIPTPQKMPNFDDPDIDKMLANLLTSDTKEDTDPVIVIDTPSEYETDDPNQPSTSAGPVRRKKKKKTGTKRRSSSVDSGRSSPGAKHKKPSRPTASRGPKAKEDSDSDTLHSPQKKRIKTELDSDSDEPQYLATVSQGRKMPDVITVSDSDSDGVRLFDIKKMNAQEKKNRSKRMAELKEKKKKRRKEHRVMMDTDLKATSRRAIDDEESRIDRLEVLQLYQNGILDKSTVELLDEPTYVEVKVHEAIWKVLQEHQREGVRFLYHNVVETFEVLQGSAPKGCILAHSMGLGKTLTVIAFLQAIFSCAEMESDFRTCLVLCPSSTVLNWKDECKKWMKNVPEDSRIEAFVVKGQSGTGTMTMEDNLSVMQDWRKRGGVLIMSYQLYLSYIKRASGMVKRKHHDRSEVRAEVLACLRDSGPDVLVCDEAHMLRNSKSQLLQVIDPIRTTARLALTGTPLQNNLDEYYTMVQFIKPSLLGTPKEFDNRFKKPIELGSAHESTEEERDEMRKRSGVLNTTLSGCLQLRDYSVQKNLPEKHEYLISLRLKANQADLYQALAASVVGQKVNPITVVKSVQLITANPRCLQLCQDAERHKINRAVVKKQLKKKKNAGSENESESDQEEDEEANVDWFEGLLPLEDKFEYTLGSKTVVIRSIILHTVSAGEKVLIFSDRLPVLSVLEELLKSIHKEELKTLTSSANGGKRIEFSAGVNYLKIDGSTRIEARHEMFERFNTRPECTVFLLAIRAAGMGVNLIGANRVILVEPMWNPTIDKQALFRAYRIGQKKPVYVYRLMSYGTLEERIGEAQLKKDLLFNHVLQEKHGKGCKRLQKTDLQYRESPYDSRKPFTPQKPPSDLCMHELLKKHPDLIVETTEYDSLMEATHPALSHEESVVAWAEDAFERNEGPWNGGNPFAGLVVDNWKEFTALLTERKCCSYPIKPENVKTLLSYVRLLCDQMPRGTRNNLRAVVKKVGMDIAKIRVVVNEVTDKKKAEYERNQAKERQLQQQLQQQIQQAHQAHTAAMAGQNRSAGSHSPGAYRPQSAQPSAAHHQHVTTPAVIRPSHISPNVPVFLPDRPSSRPGPSQPTYAPFGFPPPLSVDYQYNDLRHPFDPYPQQNSRSHMMPPGHDQLQRQDDPDETENAVSNLVESLQSTRFP